jgi:hypothetical protein
MKNALKILFIGFILLFSLSSVLAQEGTQTQTGDGIKTQTGDATGAKTVPLKNPLGDGTTVPVLIGRVITGFLGIVGSLALVMVIYGGFTWMLAAGNSEKVKKGRDIIVWAAIGLVVIFTSYALVKFVIEAIE